MLQRLTKGWYMTLIVLTVIGLMGCSVSGPVVVFGPLGNLTGKYTAELTGGTVWVSDETLICVATYDSFDLSLRVSMPIQCDNGYTGKSETGMASVVRDPSLRGGVAQLVMDNGVTATLIYGEKRVREYWRKNRSDNRDNRNY